MAIVLMFIAGMCFGLAIAFRVSSKEIDNLLDEFINACNEMEENYKKIIAEMIEKSCDKE